MQYLRTVKLKDGRECVYETARKRMDRRYWIFSI